VTKATSFIIIQYFYIGQINFLGITKKEVYKMIDLGLIIRFR